MYHRGRAYNDSGVEEEEKGGKRGGKREEEGRGDQPCESRCFFVFPLPILARGVSSGGGIFSRGDGNRGSASKGRTIRDLRMSRMYVHRREIPTYI